MVVDAGNPIVLSSDAHTPDVLGYGYEQAVAQLERLGVTEIGVFEGRRLRREPLGVSVGRTGIGWDSHRLAAGCPLILAASSSSTISASRATRTPTC
jgi:hypothetical protein